MSQLLYRIRSGDKWYRRRSGWGDSEEDSPLFTNRDRADTAIRRGIRDSASVVAAQPKYTEAGVLNDVNAYKREFLMWKASEIVEYQLERLA